mmetsp:Transcript_9335/g.20138  ORF Transcript_9335/g.20138 Transcript_9335/m.20138 type:complete len:218 (+) Transcript_9335:1260-1913(+)
MACEAWWLPSLRLISLRATTSSNLSISHNIRVGSCNSASVLSFRGSKNCYCTRNGANCNRITSTSRRNNRINRTSNSSSCFSSKSNERSGDNRSDINCSNRNYFNSSYNRNSGKRVTNRSGGSSGLRRDSNSSRSSRSSRSRSRNRNRYSSMPTGKKSRSAARRSSLSTRTSCSSRGRRRLSRRRCARRWRATTSKRRRCYCACLSAFRAARTRARA